MDGESSTHSHPLARSQTRGELSCWVLCTDTYPANQNSSSRRSSPGTEGLCVVRVCSFSLSICLVTNLELDPLDALLSGINSGHCRNHRPRRCSAGPWLGRQSQTILVKGYAPANAEIWCRGGGGARGLLNTIFPKPTFSDV